MKVYLNDQPFDVSSDVNLEAVFMNFNIEVLKGMAVAVNNSVITRASWPAFILKDGDKIILIKATQGG
jgi:sulfur carrier protein